MKFLQLLAAAVTLSGLARTVAGQAASTASQPFVTGAHNISYFPYLKTPTFKNATNQKNLTTWAVSSTFTQEFTSVQSCLPVSINLVAANNASVTGYKFSVNSTSLDQSYNLHPYVKNKVLTIALNGTLKSSDIVNVTVTIPDSLLNTVTNVTAAGQTYFQIAFDNVTDLPLFQAQIPATGVVNFKGNPDTFFLYASTNGSANIAGNLTNVFVNSNSGQPISVTNADQLTLAKTGKGSVFLGTIRDTATISQLGSGVVSINSTDNLILLQQGPGSVLANVITEANVTYAGGKNQTRINGFGTKDDPTVVTYYNSGNGTIIFTGNLVANGDLAPPAPSCINITNFSTKDCVPASVLIVPKGPEFPIKRPRCKNGDWILTDSEACYQKPKDYKVPAPGIQCQTIPPVNGGKKFALVLGVGVIMGLMVWVNSI